MAIFSKPLNPNSRRSLLVLLATILILRGRVISASKVIASQLKGATRRKYATTEELEQALQQVYVKEDDGSQTLLVPHGGVVSKVSVVLQRQRHVFPLLKQIRCSGECSANTCVKICWGREIIPTCPAIPQTLCGQSFLPTINGHSAYCDAFVEK